MDGMNYRNRDLPLVTEYNDVYDKISWEELEQLCRNGDPVALYEKASRLRIGEGVEQDFESSIEFYTRVLDQQKNTKAMYHLGRLLQASSNEEHQQKCVDYFEYGSELGDAGCTYELAYLYRDGQFKNEDAAKAIQLFKLAIAQGDSLAGVDLGEMYMMQGETQNALEEFKKAYEETGSALAAFYIGRMYYYGNGVEESDELAFPYLKAASENHIKDANVMLGAIYGFGTAVEKDVEKAMEYLDDVEECDLAYAYNIKGRLFLMENDKERGMECMRKSAELGNENAKEILEDLGKTDQEKAEEGSDPYAMIRYSKQLLNDTVHGGLVPAVKLMERAYELYPNNLDVQASYAQLLDMHGYVSKKIGADDIAYDILKKCVGLIDGLIERNHDPERVREIEISACLELALLAFSKGEDSYSLALLERTDMNTYPVAAVLKTVIHMGQPYTYSYEIRQDVNALQQVLHLDTWRNESELAGAYYTLSQVYATGVPNAVSADVDLAYDYIKKCSDLDPELALPELSKYTKNIFGKLTYKQN